MVKLSAAPGSPIGHPLWLRTADGIAIGSAPSSNNNVARIIGHQISGSGVMYFNPDNTWVVVSA